jgi:glutamate N-acetyltransferase / amino-acid N-acetyltransferase
MKRTVSFPIHLPLGFTFSAGVAGIKASGRADVALAEASPGTTAAAVFTRNRVVAAPVTVGREFLAKTRGQVRALVINSGNANCATGPAGIRHARRVCSEVARRLKVPSETVLPLSTGIIGVPLPVENLLRKLPELIATRASTESAVVEVAKAIMTTDTKVKLASAHFRAKSGKVNLLGIAKGSGMIHPQLATMLVFLFTDIAAEPGELRRLLRSTAEGTFNCISVDGDTSTNDTVLLLASGRSGISLANRGFRDRFTRALSEVCWSLSEQIIGDGEGVHHRVGLRIEQARTRKEAIEIAQAIARSLLVKTAWAGADPNWGRILAAIGAAKRSVDGRQIDILIGDQLVCRRGMHHRFDRRRAHAEMRKTAYEIRVKLGRGRADARFLTTDLSAEYVRLNAEYST